MSQENAVRELIYKALVALNEERSVEERIVIGPDTPLFGAEATLDSLSLVSVIVDIETSVADHFGRPFSLTDDRAMTRDPIPFADVANLTAYIVEQLTAAN